MSLRQSRSAAGLKRVPTLGSRFTCQLLAVAFVSFCLGALRALYRHGALRLSRASNEFPPVPFMLEDSISRLPFPDSSDPTHDHDDSATTSTLPLITSQARPNLTTDTSGLEHPDANTTLTSTINFLHMDPDPRTSVPWKPHLRLYVGIFTAAWGRDSQYGKRRRAIRETFLPLLTALPDTKAQFVVGRVEDDIVRRKLALEKEANPGAFLTLDMVECYRCLPEKTLAFFLAVHAAYAAEWVLKVDDDVYLAVPRLQPALRQYDAMGAEYIGCMLHGKIMTEQGHRWYEPAVGLLGDQYALRAFGSIYGVAGAAVARVLAGNEALLRLMANEDTTVGMWMLAFNVTFFEDRRLCSLSCRTHAVAYLDNDCSGLCNPIADMYRLHKRRLCSRPLPSYRPFKFFPSHPQHNSFDRMHALVG